MFLYIWHIFHLKPQDSKIVFVFLTFVPNQVSQTNWTKVVEDSTITNLDITNTCMTLTYYQTTPRSLRHIDFTKTVKLKLNENAPIYDCIKNFFVVNSLTHQVMRWAFFGQTVDNKDIFRQECICMTNQVITKFEEYIKQFSFIF